VTFPRAGAVLGTALALAGLAGCARVHVLLGNRVADGGSDGGGMDAGAGDGGRDGGMDAGARDADASEDADAEIADARLDTGEDAPMDAFTFDAGPCPLAPGTLVRFCACSDAGTMATRRAACYVDSDECYVFAEKGCVLPDYVLCTPEEMAANELHAMRCRAFCDVDRDETWEDGACEVVM
jgi:hypothetical protein